MQRVGMQEVRAFWTFQNVSKMEKAERRRQKDGEGTNFRWGTKFIGVPDSFPFPAVPRGSPRSSGPRDGKSPTKWSKGAAEDRLQKLNDSALSA